MSRTIVIKLWPGIGTEDLKELSNSWGFAIPVWQALSVYYFDKEMNLGDLDYLYPLYQREDVPLAHRAVLCMTFDNAYVSRKDFALAAEHIRQYLKDFPPKARNVDHWDTIADIFDSVPDCHAIGFWATSVSDRPFLGHYNESIDDYDPFKWEGAYDIYDELIPAQASVAKG